MPNRLLIACAVLCMALPLVGACSRTSAAPRGAGRGGNGAAMPVVVGQVQQKDVPVDIESIGNIEAYSTISVRSQVTGTLESALFHEGDFVKKGQRLFTIDARPFQAALDMAQANLVRDQALLAQAEANLTRDASTAEYQQLSAERQGQLTQRGILSKDTAEQAKAQADATASAVNADKAAVASANAQLAAQQGAVDAAKVSLSYTVINSPLDGRTGNIALKQGNLVTANSVELTSIAQLQPVYVTFAVPATHLPTIKSHMGGAKLPVVATPQDALAQGADGDLTFIDNAVDPTTDTIKLKATFPNTDHRLWPGQFARVRLRLEVLQHATVVAQQAMQTGQDGQFVFVVKQDSTVEQRAVVAGQHVGDDVMIVKGLQPGEPVVLEGQLRLENGTKVQRTDPTGNPAGRQGGRGGRRGGQGAGSAGGAGSPGR
ncbi:MAG TPA: efflux RND transporter periplasmic adaptor subunit [Vicinamibacterales bacterium]